MCDSYSDRSHCAMLFGSREGGEQCSFSFVPAVNAELNMYFCLFFQGSTGSSVGGDSLDGVDEGFVPVSIDLGAIRQVVAR